MTKIQRTRAFVCAGIVTVAGLLTGCNIHHLNPTLVCIRHRESDRTTWPYDKGYRAQNPVSSASGAYQFIDSTWRAWSQRSGHPGWAKAKYAPPDVQDLVAHYTITHGGRGNWTYSC